MATADRVDRGESPRDARTAARRELGNLSQIQKATRDIWGRRWIERAMQDVRYALRGFRRNPGFAAAPRDPGPARHCAADGTIVFAYSAV